MFSHFLLFDFHIFLDGNVKNWCVLNIRCFWKLVAAFCSSKNNKNILCFTHFRQGSVSRKQPKMFQIIANMVPIWVQDGVMCKAPTNLKAHDQTTVSAAMAHNLHRTHNAQPSSSPQAEGPEAEALAIKKFLKISSFFS